MQSCVGDCRHVLRTLATLFQKEGAGDLSVSFTIHEKEIEVLARQLLLLLVVLDTEVDLKERIELFLEIFGNLELTERGEEAIEVYARRLEDWITSLKPEESTTLLRFFDVSALRYQEKDELLRVFKSWRKSHSVNAQALWDYRARKFYGDRYDFRKNLIDWDYHMRLSGKEDENVIKSNKSIIHHVHFRRWRLSGMAYEFRDKKYNVPNRTLMSTVQSRLEQFKDRNLNAKGASASSYGYFGDIQNPPYCSFGLDAWDSGEEKRLFNRVNKQFEHTAVDVSKANLDFFGKVLLSKINRVSKRCQCSLIAGDSGVKLSISVAEEYKVIKGPMERVKLKFATGEKLRFKKSQPSYSAVIIGCRNAHMIQEAQNCLEAFLEMPTNMVEVTAAHQQKFEEKVLDIGASASYDARRGGGGTNEEEYLHFERQQR